RSLVPAVPYRYQATRQPVVVDWWAGRAASRPPGAPLRLTTVGNWFQAFKDISWDSETYSWSKSAEFMKVLDLPSATPHTLELALSSAHPIACALLEEHGWRLADGLALSGTMRPYRDYIVGSDGEFTAA